MRPAALARQKFWYGGPQPFTNAAAAYPAPRSVAIGRRTPRIAGENAPTLAALAWEHLGQLFCCSDPLVAAADAVDSEAGVALREV